MDEPLLVLFIKEKFFFLCLNNHICSEMNKCSDTTTTSLGMGGVLGTRLVTVAIEYNNGLSIPSLDIFHILLEDRVPRAPLFQGMRCNKAPPSRTYFTGQGGTEITVLICAHRVARRDDF